MGGEQKNQNLILPSSVVTVKVKENNEKTEKRSESVVIVDRYGKAEIRQPLGKSKPKHRHTMARARTHTINSTHPPAQKKG